MKNTKTIAIALSLILIFLLLAFYFFREINMNGTAIVNGTVLLEPVTLRYYLFENHEDAILPLVKVLESLGYRTSWENDSICLIERGEETYILDLSESTLTGLNKFGIEENYLVFAPGETHGVVQAGDREIYVNYYVLDSMMMRTGNNISRHFDFAKKELLIDSPD